MPVLSQKYINKNDRLFGIEDSTVLVMISDPESTFLGLNSVLPVGKQKSIFSFEDVLLDNSNFTDLAQ